MSIKEISKCLESELGILTKIRDIVLEKQKALICSDTNGIDLYTHQEETLLTELRKIENERLSLLKLVVDEFDKDERKVLKLSNLLAGKILQDDMSKIISYEEGLKNIILQVKEINQQNHLLIQNSLEFINETILSIIGTQKKSFIDRKV